MRGIKRINSIRTIFICAIFTIMALSLAGCGGGSGGGADGVTDGVTGVIGIGLPVRSAGAPAGILPAGTTSTAMSLTTDIGAVCQYSASPGVSYAAMTDTFVTTGVTTHATVITGLTDGTSYTYYIRCADLSVNANTDDYPISFSVASAGGTVGPQRSSGAPTGVLAAGTTQTTMTILTDIAATCKYSTTPGVSYALMANTFTTTGFTSHSSALTGLVDGTSYNYYVRCQDSAGNANTDDYPISFSVASGGGGGALVLSNAQPTGALSPGTTQTTISIDSNIVADCKYSTANVGYAGMTSALATTDGLAHSDIVTGLAGGNDYTYYIACRTTGGTETAATLAFSVLAMNPGAGNTYYVATTGSDSNSGGINSPWRTIRHSIQIAGPGDTVIVKDGTYGGEAWVQGFNGQGGSAAGGYLTIKAQNPGMAIRTYSFRIEANYVKIEGFHMIGPSSISTYNGGSAPAGTPLIYGDHVEIRNNTFTGQYNVYAGAIDVMGDNTIVENNTLNLTYTGSPNDHGIYVLAGENFRANNIIVRNNYITGYSGFGIHVYDERKNYGDPVRVISNITVENNIVMGSETRSGIIVAAGTLTRISGVKLINNVIAHQALYGIGISYYGSGIDDIQLLNNTIYDVGAQGVYIRDSRTTNVLIKNNIIDTKGAAIPHIDNYGGAVGVTADNNLYWPGPVNNVNVTDVNAITGDPAFVNLPGDDFHLTPASAATDTGLPLTVDVPTDKDGVARHIGAGYDIGAYESH